MKTKDQKQTTKNNRLKSLAEWIIPILTSATAVYTGDLVGAYRQRVGCFQGGWSLILPWTLAVLGLGLAIYKLTLTTIKNKRLWPIIAAALLAALTILFGFSALDKANHCVTGG